jgi:DNA-binding IscR family transcriptional regulator
MVRRENALRDLFEITEESLTPATNGLNGSAHAVLSEQLAHFEGASEAELRRKRGVSEGALRGALQELRRAGWVESVRGGCLGAGA